MKRKYIAKSGRIITGTSVCEVGLVLGFFHPALGLILILAGLLISGVR